MISPVLFLYSRIRSVGVDQAGVKKTGVQKEGDANLFIGICSYFFPENRVCQGGKGLGEFSIPGTVEVGIGIFYTSLQIVFVIIVSVDPVENTGSSPTML